MTALLTLDQKRRKLTRHGFYVGKRLAGFKPDHRGSYMVADDSDARRAWAIVGDDLDTLIVEAFDHFEADLEG